MGTAKTQQSFFRNTYYRGRCYSWFYCVLSHSLIVYLLYSPSITFQVGFYADPIRVKHVIITNNKVPVRVSEPELGYLVGAVTLAGSGSTLNNLLNNS